MWHRGRCAPTGGDYTKLPETKNQWIYTMRNNILRNSINPLHTILNVQTRKKEFNQISFELTKHCMIKRIRAVCNPAATWLLKFTTNVALNQLMTAIINNVVCGLQTIDIQGGGARKTKNFNKYYSRKYQKLKSTNMQKGGEWWNR